MPDHSPLPVTERTRHRRLREQGSTDRTDLADILAAGVICHLGVVVDGYPMVVPTEHAGNYRSAMISGTPRLGTDGEEKRPGLRPLSEHTAPGQWDYARRPNKKELA